MFGLTTFHGTVLCFDRAEERVFHRAPAAVDPADLVLFRDPATPEFGVFEPHGGWRPIDIGLQGASRATAPPRLAPTQRGDTVTFRSSLGFLVAPPDGTIRLDGQDAHAWEWFGIVERVALTSMLDMARHDWLRLAVRDLVPAAAISLENRTNVRIGAHLYPIAGNFPLSGGTEGRHRHLLFRDGWIVDQFVRFKPLVYFVLMGAGPYADQLALATASLVEFGRYDGDVLIITDRDKSFIEQLLPVALHARLSVMRVASSGKVDAVLARLMLGEHASAASHSPILYTDTDVIFDRPLRQFLEAALLSGRMSAQSEPWNALPHSDAAGGDLFAVDPIPFNDPTGFNAGIWSMPGGHDTIQILQAIRIAVSRYLELNGRDSLPWLDQAMGNYMLRKLDAFDASLVTTTTRLRQSYEPLDPAGAAGFVHFWPVSAHAADRAAAMADYLGQLRSASGDQAGSERTAIAV